MIIKPKEVEILRSAFKEFISEPSKGVYKKTFRIKHAQDLDLVDNLERIGLLEKNAMVSNGYYTIPLVALSFFEEAGVTSIIRDKVAQFHIYTRECYMSNPDEEILFSEVLKFLKIPEIKHEICLHFFKELDVWSSWSETGFTASEEVIRRSFDDILSERVEWISQKASNQNNRKNVKEYGFRPQRMKTPQKNNTEWVKAKYYPEEINKLFSEIYRTKEVGCTALPSMGLRAIIERVGYEKVGDVNFKAMVKGLVKQGLLNETEEKSIESVIEFGHASAHRGHFPKKQELGDAIAIVRHLVEKIYALEKRAENLVKSTPKRK